MGLDLYEYEDSGEDTTNLPVNSLLTCQTDSDSIYFVDSVDQTILRKFVVSTGTESTVSNQSYNIISLWHASAEQKLYYCYGFKSGSSYLIYTRYIDLTDDSDNADDSIGIGADSGAGRDIMRNASDTIAWIMIELSVGPTHYVKVYQLDLTDNVYNRTHALETNASAVWASIDISRFLLIGSIVYFLYQTSADHVEIWKSTIQSNSWTKLEDCGANLNLPDDEKYQTIVYDGSDVLYFILKDLGDANKNKLCSYVISTDTFTKHSEYNVEFMRHRYVSGSDPPYNTAKGISPTADIVYQVPLNMTGNLNRISDFDFGGLPQAVTDNYLIDASKNVYEYKSFIDYVSELDIRHPKKGIPTARLKFNRSKFEYSKDNHILIYGTYTTAGSTSTEVIFYGRIDDLVDEALETITCTGVANELNYIKPSGEYSGRTDEIISSLISDYCGYISEGTLGTGAEMGTITFGGDKTLATILNDFCDHDRFIWYVTPTGVLYYNDGTTDSAVNYSESDSIWNISARFPSRKINKVEVTGAYVDGVQTSGDWEEAEAHLRDGVNLFTSYDSSLDTDALCDTKATELGTLGGADPTTATFKVYDSTNSFIQVGEEITLSYASNNVTISSDQFIIDEIRINRHGICEIICTNGILFLGTKNRDLAQENSQRISQVADTTSENKVNIGSSFPANPHDGKQHWDTDDEALYMYSSDAQAWIQVGGAGMSVSDVAYAASWDGVTKIAPSKNAVYDKIDAMIEDDAFGAGWNGDTTHAPSQNAVYDMVKDEDDMASDSDVHVATQQSITAYVDSKASVFTGNYTGNGTNDRDLGITFNTISAAWMFDTTSGADMYVKTPEMSGEYAKSFSTFLHVNTRARLTTSNTKIEVSGSLNTSGRIYRYIVFCDV